MSLTPVTQNFASVTHRVFCDSVVFSGGASSRFTLSKCFRVGDAKTGKRSHLPSSDFYKLKKLKCHPTAAAQFKNENAGLLLFFCFFWSTVFKGHLTILYTILLLLLVPANFFLSLLMKVHTGVHYGNRLGNPKFQVSSFIYYQNMEIFNFSFF